MTDFAIGISYPQNFPKGIISDFSEMTSSTGLKVLSRDRENQVMMAMEWAVPTLVITYLAKPYFDAFLTSAGNDHYAVLKTAVLKLTERLRSEPPKSLRPQRSRLFSIQATTKNTRTIKCLFPEQVTSEQCSKMLDELHKILLDDHVSEGGTILQNSLIEAKSLGGINYLEYSIEETSWIVINTHAEMANRVKQKPKS